MEVALGAILAAGHPLEVLDRWSWDQVELAASAITSYHAHVLSSVFQGLAPERSPSKKRPRKGAASSPAKATAIDRTNLDAVKRAHERDARNLELARRMGLDV